MANHKKPARSRTQNKENPAMLKKTGKRSKSSKEETEVEKEKKEFFDEGHIIGREANEIRNKPEKRIKDASVIEGLEINKHAFHRIVKNILENETDEIVTRFTPNALAALQVAAEDYMTALFEDSFLCSLHARRITLYKSDMVLAMRIRKEL